MRILLSVKPTFVHEIMTGKKLYEFRKQLFKNSEVKTIVIYASSPVCKVIGEFEIGNIIKDTPVNVWEKTKLYSGISESFYFRYFENKDIAYAIEITNIIAYPKPLALQDFRDGIKPPQSFCYID